MTLQFDERIINDKPLNPRNFVDAYFIGYLNPNGEEINYSRPFGLGGHDNNPTTDLFMKFFITHEIYSNKDSYFYKTPEEIVKDDIRNTNFNRKNLEEKLEVIRSDLKWFTQNRWELLKYNLLSFFFNCYQNDSFVEGFGKDCSIMSRDDFEEKVYSFIDAERERLYPTKEEEDYMRYWDRIPLYYDFNFQYDLYRKQLKLDKFKDAMVQYIGYHYVARTPRTIYTSEFNIYETFYNYLLNDFTIIRLPKMIYDDINKKYVEVRPNEFLISDSELRLKDEINSIKKMVKKDDRYKYYR